MAIDLNQLETFLAVAELKSFSRAAERLRRTQPAVSQVVRKLEADIGEVLFERTSRDGTLTAAGEVLRGYAERLLALRREATISPMIDTAISAGLTAPISSPIGAWIRDSAASSNPCARMRSIRLACVFRDPSAPM